MATPTYIKPSAVKAIIPPTTNTGVDINTQVGNIKKQYGNMNTEQLYGAMLNVKPPAQQDILQSVGTQYGYNDRIAWLREQAWEIQRQMLSDQSALFGATNPDGTPVDPRVKVSQFQENITRGSQRLQQIQKIQDVYAAEMQTLAGAIAEQYKAKAQDTQTAIQFMQQLNQEKNADRSYAFQREQFDWQKNQANEPKWTSDGAWGFYDANSSSNPSSQKSIVSQVFSSPFQKSKSVSLNSQAMQGFSAAMDELQGMGINTLIGSTTRSKEEQSKLYSDYQSGKWGIAAPPGQSKHESGNGIDIYSDDKFSAPTQAQIKAMEKNGWKHMAIPWDMGHFEYVGTSGVQNGTYSPQSDAKLSQIWSNDTGGMFYDERTGKTISWEEANALYGTKPTDDKVKSLWIYMKDNQDRGAWYSNDDVKAFNEKIDRLVKEGDEKWMALAYRNMVMKDKDFKKEFDDTTVFVKALDTVQQMVDEYEKAGKSTNALKGFAEKVARKLWVTQDEALAQLQTQLGVTMANYIRSISGTAASDVEVQRLMGNMAQIGNVKDLNTAIVEQVKTNGMNGIKQMIDNRMYGMPEELKPQVFGDIYTADQKKNQSWTVASIPWLPPWRFQSQTWTGVGRWQQSNQ